MKNLILCGLFALSLCLSPFALAHDASWQDAMQQQVRDAYFEPYSEEEVVTVAAQGTVRDDTLGLHEAFVALWELAQLEDPELSLGAFIFQAEAFYQQVHDEEGGHATTSTVRTRGTMGGF